MDPILFAITLIVGIKSDDASVFAAYSITSKYLYKMGTHCTHAVY